MLLKIKLKYVYNEIQNSPTLLLLVYLLLFYYLFFIPGTILTKFYIYYIQWYFDINKHLNSTNSSSQFCRSVIPS